MWPAGLLAITMPLIAKSGHFALGMPEFSSIFDGKALNWLGLVSRKPFTEDYVPVFPWLGVVWWGLAAGRWVQTERPRWLSGASVVGVQPLAFLGRWSLTWYMLHQPVMIGAFMAVAALR